MGPRSRSGSAFWRVVLYMATIAAYCALLLAVYLATKNIWRFEVKFPFRPDKPLQLDVAGCDVVLMSTNTSRVGTVVLHGEWVRLDTSYITEFHEVESGDEATKSLQSLDIMSADCNADPMLLCSRSCRVEITIPTDPLYPNKGEGFIRIGQHADDKSKQVVVYNVGDLDLTVPIRVAGPSIRLALGENKYGGTSVAVNAGVSAWLTVGDAVVSSATFGPDVSVTLSSSKGNVRAMVDATGNINTKVRSSNNFVCMIAAEPARITETPPLDTLTACNADEQSLAMGNQYLMKYYNPDNAYWANIEPFRTAMTEKMGKCCGTHCPLSAFESWRRPKNCDNVVQAVFPDQTLADSAGRFGRLEGGQFLTNLIAANDTSLLPLCRPAGKISIVEEVSSAGRRNADTAGSGESAESDEAGDSVSVQASQYQDVVGAGTSSLTLLADLGEARVVTAANAKILSPNPTFYKPEGASTASPGLRLLDESARQLAHYRDTFGPRDAADDVYLTIHVPETDEHPGGVFIYSSNTVFLALSPSFLAVIGGFALIPETEQVLVHFASDDCDSTTYNAVGEKWSKDDHRYEERMAQVHAVLTRAITPFNQLSVRGKLVRLPSDVENTELCEERHTLAFNNTPQEFVTQGGQRILQTSSRKWKRNVRACRHTSLFHPMYQALHQDLDIALDGTVDCIDDGVDDNNNTDSDCQNGIFVAEVYYEGQHRMAMNVFIFSVVVSCIIGSFVMYLVISKAKEKLKRRYQEFEVSFKLGVRGAPPPSEDITKSASFMPLEIPIELFQIVVPYRGMFIDSLKRFFRYRYRPMAPEDAVDRTCWTLRGYQNNAVDSKRLNAESLVNGSTNARYLAAEKIAAQRDQETHDSVATKLEHYQMQGVPLAMFKERYTRYCLDGQLSEVTEPMDIREFLMMKETDPGTTDIKTCAGFKVAVRKQQTVKGVKVDSTLLEQLEDLLDNGNLKHVLSKALLPEGKRKASTMSFLEDLIPSCCTALTKTKENRGKRRLKVNRTVLEYATGSLDEMEKSMDSSTLWSSVAVMLFVAFCSTLRSDTEIGTMKANKKNLKHQASGLSQEEIVKVMGHAHPSHKPMKKKQGNVTTLSDFSTMLLDFLQTLQDADIDKASIKEMLESGGDFGPSQFLTEPAQAGQFIHMNEVAPKDLKDILQSVLGIEVSHAQSSRKTISNLRLAHDDELEGMPSWADAKEAMIDVITQVTVLVLLPVAALMSIAAYGQGIYSITNGAANNPLTMSEFLLGANKIIGKNDHEDIVGVTDYDTEKGGFLQGTDGDPRGMFMWANAMYWISFVYGAFWLARLIYSYYMPANSLARQVFYKIFGLVLTLTVWGFCIWVTMAAIWLMFSAILDPEANLVKGVILVMVVTVVSKLASRLFALKSKVMAAVYTRLDKLLHDKVFRFMKENPNVANNVADNADIKDGKDIPMDEIFAMLDENNTNTLTFDEFNNLFDLLEMNIPLDEQQRMYQFADVDGNGTITMDEFEASWSYLKDGVVVTLIKRLGLDDSDILRNVAILLGLFLVLIPLFLAMIALWDNNSSFVSVVHSLFIGATGIMANGKKAKAEAKDGEVTGMQDSIDNVLKGFGESTGAAVSAHTDGNAKSGAVGAAFGFGKGTAEQVTF